MTTFFLENTFHRKANEFLTYFLVFGIYICHLVKYYENDIYEIKSGS